ncbi:hypothetical protein B0T17DRAFT_513349 [Bombardia bombarda]|uniref:Uncharacterized protein n=1 Tax=Bombardia bombarda TaxID=252184 RepID=A0AA39XIS8_9PEZI|nr:hypothetical protein B0T17DRAFT_513349 [Bombardia bombarda]
MHACNKGPLILYRTNVCRWQSRPTRLLLRQCFFLYSVSANRLPYAYQPHPWQSVIPLREEVYCVLSPFFDSVI